MSDSEQESQAASSRSPSPAPESAAQTGVEGEKKPQTFAELGIIPELCAACEAVGYKKPTDIQVESIPHALAGRDIIGLAKTGSGKTAAFSLPILQNLWEKPQPFYALIMAPTR